jgi:V/A-type H+-transporting ATPase subunit A
VALSSGRVVRVNGPVIQVEGLEGAAMNELVDVGEARLPGEIIALENARAIVQVYEYTGGMRPGEPVVASGQPLVAELGPGLLGEVFDGMLGRLGAAGDFVEPGVPQSTLSRDRRWLFSPTAARGDAVGPGACLGIVPETIAIEHRVLVPPAVEGRLEWIADRGDVAIGEPIAAVGGADVTLAQRWPVRRPRPFRERLEATVPLVTGQRVLDLLFPIAHGSAGSVPGGFGTGKTVLLQQIAKWCDADVIVYVGCGERGNEMADVLAELRELEDPRTGRSLLGRTVLVANTSNMPVLAREASIYTGVTVAEFYRDMGYDAVLIADSTSRWAEALREVVSRTNQLPAEEGYPAGLASQLAAFYERAARVETLGGAEGAVTIIGAVSPPGGDMSEPVAAHTSRFVRCTWSLDRNLAYARHYPAVSWRDSWSKDAEQLAERYLMQRDTRRGERRTRALTLLAEADRIESIAELVGVASLPAAERIVLRTGRLLREAVLQQSAVSENDAYCEPAKQAELLVLVLAIHDRCQELAAQGVSLAAIEEVDLSEVVRIRDEAPPDGAADVAALRQRILTRLGALGG